jgi:cytoskeleton protein RodZ
MDEPKEMPVAEKNPSPREAFQELKELREARGLTLHDLFEMTRISLINITAVEDGDFDRLPPPVYARNFIRKYARAIGIDEKPILDRYEKYLESLKPPREEVEVQKPWPETGRRYRFLAISLAAVVAAGILVSAIFLYDQGGKAPSPVPVSESTSQPQVMPIPAPTADAPPPPVAQVPAAQVAPAPAPAVKSVLPPAAAGKIYHLVIDARELTWIRITEDQNSSYQVLLKPGEKIERMASDYFLLDIGNAGGIDLIFQGKSLGHIGKQGEIVHMRLPEKGAERKSP